MRFGVRLFGALALAALPWLGGVAQAQGQAQAPTPPAAPQPPPNREFTVQNETDLVLQNLYVYPPNANDRGADRLGSDVVQPGANFRVRLGRTRDCTYDIVGVFQDGSEDLRRRVDICRNQRQVFGDPAMPRLEASIANRAQLVLRELYVSARGPEAWGPDRLGSAVIEPAAAFALRLRTRDCVFDIRAVWADDREEIKSRVDLCATREQVFDRSGVPRPPVRPMALVNRHLAMVQEVYVSASTESDWGPDRLGANTLAMAAEVALEIEGACEVDLRIVFPNGGAEERREVNICETPRIILAPGWVIETVADSAAAAPPAAAGPGAGRALRNLGALPIIEIYTAAAGQPRGEDRLGAQTLPVAGTITLAPADPAACEVELTVVFRDGREATQTAIDLCNGPEIELR
jgi:hypothetical protein